MARGIDHLVLPVRDLSAARSTYAALGFTLTPRAVHPFGTANSLIQLQGCYLELLEIDAPDKIPPSEEPASFAQFNRDFLENTEGFSMLVVTGGDAEEDYEAFRAAGLAAREPFSFERDAELPDGSTGRVAFTLVFVDYPHAKNTGFFTCSHHRPEVFWQRAYANHANGACSIADVELIAPDADAMGAFIAALSGAQAVVEPTGGRVVDTGRGTVSILPARPGDKVAPRFASFTLKTRDLAGVADHARRADIACCETQSGLEFGSQVMYGVQVKFSAA
ncbi:MAG: VOC family protein [Hyphomicrobiales bacterium]|nr:VOC family protein [Hyphomicrobiales bacterium]